MTLRDPNWPLICKHNFRLFCEWCFANRFTWHLSHEQLRAITAIEAVVLIGGNREAQLDRGCGKSSLAVAAAAWVGAYRHRELTLVVGRTKAAAEMLIEDVAAEFRENTRLRKLVEDQHEPAERPHIIGVSATGQFRGLTLRRDDGTFIRPSLMIVDDVDRVGARNDLRTLDKAMGVYGGVELQSGEREAAA